MSQLGAILLCSLLSVGCQQLLGIEEIDDEPSPDATDELANLEISEGQLLPAFDREIYEYTVLLPLAAEDLAVTPTAAWPQEVSITVASIEVASGQESSAHALALGDSRIEVAVALQDEPARTYTITTRRGAGILQQAYAKASNTGAYDAFGRRIALHGDTLAVASHLEASNATEVDGEQNDDTASGSGAVYVFVRSGSDWRQQAYLKASNTEADDHFGISLALDGDTLAVGASGEDSADARIEGDQADNSSGQAGAVYVFVRSGSTWSKQAYLKASNADADDSFGGSLALEEDILAVGASIEHSAAVGIDGDQTDNSAALSGAVYVFVRDDASWSQEAYLKASNTEANDLFGDSLALSGDTLAVGAWAEAGAVPGVDGDQQNNDAGGSGAVYVFLRHPSGWQQQAYIKASNPGGGDRFGFALDLDGDTLAVGAPGEASAASGVNADQSSDSAALAGAVYIFERSDASWEQEVYIKASNADPGDLFGESVALDGDALAVGAPGERSVSNQTESDPTNNTAPEAGAVYLLGRHQARWAQLAYLKASDAEEHDLFGTCVALDGGILAVGARGEDSGALGVGGEQSNSDADDSGAVYLLE